MTQTANLILDFAAATDIGCKRGNNEDSFGYDSVHNLYVVCDGMGGRAAGEVASATAVRVLIETFEAQTTAAESGGSVSTIEARLLESIREANRAVCEASRADVGLNGMGTTLVCACMDGSRILIGNVGDSRAYIIRNGNCMQITLDHSLIDEQVRHGIITPEMASASTLKSVITRAIGAGETVEPDFFGAELQPGDVLLLVSDGLTRYVEAEEIASLADGVQQLSAACQTLIDAAKRRGGADNITCMMLRAVESTETPGPRSHL